MKLGLVTIVVRDYDDAKAFYLEKLGFALIEDSDLGGGKRWLVVSPGATSARLLLAKAKNEAERRPSEIRQAGAWRCFLKRTISCVITP